VIYVFDTNCLSNVLNHYYQDRFPSFWERFDNAVAEGSVVSVNECKLELTNKFSSEEVERLSAYNQAFFAKPTAEEMKFVTQIYARPHFQHNLDKKKLLEGGYFADPFVIARAKTTDGAVVTEEALRENAAKIPNICKYFDIPCLNLEGFLLERDWKF
jgi:hypothetical protein